MAEAAERALVSRATAYRYLPSQQSLLIEVEADATQADPEAVLSAAGSDLEDRVEAMTRTITRMVLADEALFRNQLRASQDVWFARDTSAIPVREGRRLVWIDKAIAPAPLSRSERLHLRNALAVVIGVEPVISLRDVCGLSAKATEDTLVATAKLIARNAVAPDSGRAGGA